MDSAVFGYFPLLPPELRLLIWRYAIPLFPRIVTVRPTTHLIEPIERASQSTSNLAKWRITTSGVPPLLSINWESRQEFLRYCNISFDPINTTSTVPDLRFSYLTDTFYIDIDHTLQTRVPISRIFEELFTPSSYIILKKQLRRFAGSHWFWHSALATKSVKALDIFQKVDDWRLVANVVENVAETVNQGTVVGFEQLAWSDWNYMIGLLMIFTGIKVWNRFENDVKFCRELTE
jgi:hypothetical protein